MKAKYTEYDYEELYNQEIDRWSEQMALQLLGRAKGVYATKEIRFGGQMDVEIYPEFSRKEAEEKKIPRIDKAVQRERMEKLQGRNARKYFKRLADNNFGDGDLWITLTYAQEPESTEEAIKHMQRYIRNINNKRRRRGLPNAKYIYVTETTSEDGKIVRIHHHMLMDGMMEIGAVIETWKNGGRNEYRKIQTDENGIAGAAEYMAKPEADKHRKKHEKRWTSSRNLKKPEEKKHHQTRAREINKMVQDHDYIKGYIEKAKTRSGKLRYEGYTYVDADTPRYNAVNGSWYIHIKLRKADYGKRKHYVSTYRDDERGNSDW